MKKRDSSIEAFLALVRGGLWEKEVQLLQFGIIDYEAIYRLSEEQTITGLVAAGLEHVIDQKVPQRVALTYAGVALQLEQRNLAMNKFIAEIISKMREAGINSLLVKGQGIAQCYERPLWRAAGDIDLFLNENNFDKAVDWCSSSGKVKCDEESRYKKHIAFRIKNWDIELHGTLRGELGSRIDKVIDTVQKDTFKKGRVRVWDNDNTEVFIPVPDNDVVFVFAHILQHFFRGGIGLRQICDWCRLLWIYRDSLDRDLLEHRLCSMDVMSEWYSFATFAVDVLGMPQEAMPFYSMAVRWQNKSRKILRYIFKVGNFGLNRDMSYKTRYPFLVRFMISVYYRTNDFVKQIQIFPLDAMRAYVHLWSNGFEFVRKQIRK